MFTNSPLESIIAKKMKDASPALDINGSDRKILQIACQDFINYVKFTWETNNEETDNCAIAEKMAKLLEKDSAEAESFIAVWVGLWLAKWKQRVRLVLSNQVQTPGATPKTGSAKHAGAESLESEQEILQIVVSSLIRNAEICGTEIIAENILRLELTKTQDSQLNETERAFAVLNGALRRAREMTQNISPVISLKVDKAYFAPAPQ